MSDWERRVVVKSALWVMITIDEQKMLKHDHGKRYSNIFFFTLSIPHTHDLYTISFSVEMKPSYKDLQTYPKDQWKLFELSPSFHVPLKGPICLCTHSRPLFRSRISWKWEIPTCQIRTWIIIVPLGRKTTKDIFWRSTNLFPTPESRGTLKPRR